MSASSTNPVRTRLETVIALARLLERVESSPARVDADQYRRLVTQLTAALSDDLPAQALDAILAAHPAAAELYENLHYRHAGLSRVSLERSVASERLASRLIAQVAAAAKPAG
jgi:hypothetical protein